MPATGFICAFVAGMARSYKGRRMSRLRRTRRNPLRYTRNGWVAIGVVAMGEVTELLQRVASQDIAARDPLYRALYPELMQLARGHLARVGTTSLDVSGLIHDAYLRLERSGSLPHQNRRVFLAYASKVMRS